MTKRAPAGGQLSGPGEGEEIGVGAVVERSTREAGRVGVECMRANEGPCGPTGKVLGTGPEWDTTARPVESWEVVIRRSGGRGAGVSDGRGFMLIEDIR